MRCGLLLVALLGSTWGNRLAAQEPPRKPQGLGQLVVVDPQSGSPVRLNLARYHVNIVLHPPVALVQIDQSFFNPFATQQEGTFVFNLPAGASVSRFAMYTTPTQLIEGELLERKNASSIYQSIVTRRRDPAILEQIGSNLFKMRVFPIFARDTKRILLDFTLPIAEQDGSLYTVELPLMSDLEPVWDFAVQGTIRGPNVAGTARCDSHADVEFADAGDGSLKFRFAAQKYRPESAFSLKFQQRQSDAVVVRSFTPAPIVAGVPAIVQPDQVKTPVATQFLATVNPAALEPIARAAAAEPAPADVLILADTSGGTTGQGRLRQAVRAICGALRNVDRFALGCIDVDFRPLTRGWTAPRSQQADQALADFNREVFLGATDLVQSFRSALKSLSPVEPGRRRLIVYVGDGEIALKGPSILFVQHAMADGLVQAGVRFSAVLHRGGQTAGAAIEKPVAATGGRLLQIDAGGSFAELSGWVRAGCRDAVKIISVQAAGVDDDDLFAPPTWVPGRSLPIYGRRMGAGPLKLHVTLERDGQPEAHFWQLDLKDNPDDMFVGRLWAQLKLDQLQAHELRREQRAFWEQSLEPQIIALSQEWTLLTPQTAFLVLENEAEYPRYGIVRRIRHTYWKPEDSLRAAPLPREVLTALRQPMQASQTTTRDQVTKILLSARRALDDHAPRRALNLLARVADSDVARDSSEFTALREAAAGQIARQGVLREIGPNRGWFDRSQAIGFDIPVRDLAWRLVQGYGTSRAGDDPRLASLDKEVAPPPVPTSIEEFADWIEAASGLDVALDRARLQQDGVALDAEYSLRGIRSMSLENLLKHRLAPQQLAHVFEDGVLKITTAAHAADKLTTRLYPIGDIIQSTLATDYSLLASVSLDRELMAHRRLEQSLDRKVSVDFDKLPLDAVLQFLSDNFRDNMIIDRLHLGEDGIPLDRPVTLQRRDAPLRQVLAQIFEQHGLAMSIESEAVIITTQSHAADRLITRLHSAQGIVYELPSDLMKTLPQKPVFRGMAMGGMGMGMGMGGAGGGGGGAGGFGGGGGGFGFGGSMGGGNIGGGMGGFIGGGTAGFGGGGSGVGSGPQGAAVSEFSPAGSLIADVDGEDPEPAQLPEVPRGGVDDDFEMSTVWKLQQSPGGFALPQPARHVNDMGMMNLISTSIQPDSWEELSGPGSMLYYPGALSFAIRQTSAIHAEIDELLDHLREMPPMFSPRSGYRPAQIPTVGPDDFWDLTTLMNMISLVIKPDSWEELSGPGAIVPHRLKLALSIRQTQAIHHELRDFFTALRRARYQARLGKNWKSFDLAQGPPFGTITGLTDLRAGTPLSESAEPNAAEIEALGILEDPMPGTYVWRSSMPKSGALRSTTIRLGTTRSEFEFDGRLIRTAGDEATVVYPGITLVERGTWGSAARRLVDGRLPWMPHRSTRELARLFDVRTAAADEKTVQLRLALPDAATAGEILITVSRELRLPIAWEARIGAHTMLRLRFENRHEQAGRSLWKTVIAEDEDRREVERWELVTMGELKADVPPLDAGWGDQVVVDLRDQVRPGQSSALKALQAIRNGDWKGTEQAIDQALEVQPGQPLLEFARVWALRQSSEIDAAVFVKALRRLVEHATPDFFALLAERPFEGIDDGTFYEILQLQPTTARRLVNLDNLARFAARAGRPREAIDLLTAAVAQPDTSQAKGERVHRLVELLLESRRIDEAVAVAESRAAQAAVSPDELAALAEALHKGGDPATATKLMRAALADPQPTGEGRHRLLLKRAALEKDQVRWRTIAEAINELPEASPLRTSSIDLLLGELTEKSQADAVGQLVEIARHPRLRTLLTLRQAELFVEASNSDMAARLGWELYLDQRLPADQLDWLFERLFAAKHYAKLVRLAEERLHSGHPLSQPQLDWLAATYDDLGLALSARRARTNSSEIDPPATKPERPDSGRSGSRR